MSLQVALQPVLSLSRLQIDVGVKATNQRPVLLQPWNVYAFSLGWEVPQESCSGSGIVQCLLEDMGSQLQGHLSVVPPLPSCATLEGTQPITSSLHEGVLGTYLELMS